MRVGMLRAGGLCLIRARAAARNKAEKHFWARAAAILRAYADRYPSFPRHNTRGEDRIGGGKLLAQTVDESVWLIPAADLIREHKMGIHNIQCWKNSAVGLVGLVTGRDELVREAIDDPDRGFRAQIAKGVTEQGLWYEGSLGYHAYTMQALWPLAEAARLAGIDLYTERYRRLYEAPLALALPNVDTPGFNDSAGGNLIVRRRAAETVFDVRHRFEALK